MNLLGGIIARRTAVKFTKEQLHHNEVVELYKERITGLELELELARNEKDKYEGLLFRQLGLNQDVTVTGMKPEDMKFISRPMSPGRLRNSLEHDSRMAAGKK